MTKIALISDIHEDIISLKKALKMIEAEKCDQIVCLGDILGFPIHRGKYAETRNAAECVSLIKSTCTAVILGNHDLFHLRKLPESLNGFRFPDGWFSLSPEQQTVISGNKVWNYSDDYPVDLGEREREYLCSLPEYFCREYHDKKLLFSHFVFPNFSAYVSSFNGNSIRLKEHFNYMKQHNIDLSFCGHMHMEGIGIGIEPAENLLSKLFQGFFYYSYGERKLKHRNCCITIPALADNSQVNGFAVFDTLNHSINVVSLNINRRFIL